jgi:DNA-binding IclR family transcriptional regulator
MTAPKLLKILQLFTVERPLWRVAHIAAQMQSSPSTAYRCVAQLVRAGLLEPVAGGAYALGPAFIEFDRRMRLSDPLLRAAGPSMQRLLAAYGAGATVALARCYRDCVMFVHIERGRDAPQGAYDRGEPLSLFRSAASRAILAALPDRVLRRLYRQQADEVAREGLGHSAREFNASLRLLRTTPWCIADSVMVPGRIGVAAAIVATGGVLGSLAISLPAGRTAKDTAAAGRRVTREARAVAARLAGHSIGSPRLISRRSAPARPRAAAQSVT